MPTSTRRARALTRALALALALLPALAVLVAPRSAAACEAAYHYRVFPLGVADGWVIALTLDLNRFSRSAEGPTIWSGTWALVKMDGHGQLLEVIKDRSVVIPDHPTEYAEGLRPILAAALERAREIEGFVAFGRPEVRFCDFKRRCAFASWTRTPEGRLAVDVKLGEAKGRGLVAYVPPEVQRTLYESSTSYFSRYPRRLLLDVLAAYPYPFSSVRVYRGGGRTIFVAHAGFGQLQADGDPDYDMVRDRMRALPRGACPALASCTYIEPTAHHGHGFDLVLSRGVDPPATRIVEPIDPDFTWSEEDLRIREEEDAARARRDRAAALAARAHAARRRPQVDQRDPRGRGGALAPADPRPAADPPPLAPRRRADRVRRS